MNLSKKLKESIGGMIIATLLGSSLALTLADAMGLSLHMFATILPCVITAISCTLMTLGAWPLTITLAALAIGGAASVYFKLPAYENMYQLVMALLTDGDITASAAAIEGLMGVLLTAMAFLMTRIRGGVYPALTLLVLVAMGSWLFGQSLNIYCVAPALIAVAMLFASSAREKTSFNAALPIALTAVIAALALMPVMGGVSPALQQFGRNVRTMIGDYLMFSEARTLYSVQSDGYQTSTSQLGGNANPSDFPIMEVDTDVPLLLRGAIKREYTGSVWVDTAVNSRNLFISPLRHGLRNQVFGLDMPERKQLENAPDGLITTADASIKFLSRGTSTLFTPHRLMNLNTGADMIPYFNSSGEVFITRTVRAGDSYSFSAQIPDTYSEDMESYLSSLKGDSNGPGSVYLELPDTISTNVYDLTYSIIRGHQTPYAKARAIENYLKANCRYTLTPGSVPEGEDFVSYFLLESRTGYCTYFASAMGVMARIAGIPTRYVEGYLVEPAETGSTEVIGKDAHAWVELYFDGFGWLSFDPTPDGDGMNSPQPSPDPDDIQPEEQPTPTPEPTPEPTSNVPPDATPAPSLPPKMLPEDEPTALPSDAPDHDGSSGAPRLWLIALGILLLILLLIGIAALRLYMSTPRYQARKARTAADKLMVYYRALLTILEMQGQVPMSGETPAAFAQRLTDEKLAAPSFAAFTDAVVHSRYAGQPASPDMCLMGISAYDDAVKAMRLREKLRWYRRRIRHGMGSVQHIP